MLKDRCGCGNLVPAVVEFKEFGGTCRVCARERKEARDTTHERAEFERRKAMYLSSHPFYSYMK
jgi:hypothetical protein